MDPPTPRLITYVVSNELIKVSSLLPSNRMRSMLVHSLIHSLGLLSPSYSSDPKLAPLTPKRALRDALSMYHTNDYLDFVLNPRRSAEAEEEGGSSNSADFGLEDDCPIFKGLSDYVPLVAGATLTAASSLINGNLNEAICWDGGRHHAQKSHASGFCYVADCILALLALKRYPMQKLGITHRKSRIMYLDLDLHFSDAVSLAFHTSRPSTTPQILTLSIHHTSSGFFPISEFSGLPDPTHAKFDPFTLSIPLCKGASDSTYARIWPIVESVRSTYDPDIIVIQCGLDALAGDPCATFNWSLGANEGSYGWCIQRIHKEWRGKKLYLGGGGYNSPNAARAWAYLTSILLDNPLSLDTEIPDHSAFPLYAPSFTLDIPAGNMADDNTESYLQTIEERYQIINKILNERMKGTGDPRTDNGVDMNAT
ncbi:hypothetical protein ONZ45_g6551 [Pleurotus djamor]|nr:hypothetical protein ONZ45_g6551 [Pleurotus djamor]